MMAIYRYFRWGYVLLGLIAMSMAAISWTREDSKTYWIWHRYKIIHNCCTTMIPHPQKKDCFPHVFSLIVPSSFFSIWHISIYTSAFFFICSKAKTQNVDNQEAPAAASYELTRQESFASV